MDSHPFPVSPASFLPPRDLNHLAVWPRKLQNSDLPSSCHFYFWCASGRSPVHTLRTRSWRTKAVEERRLLNVGKCGAILWLQVTVRDVLIAWAVTAVENSVIDVERQVLVIGKRKVASVPIVQADSKTPGVSIQAIAWHSLHSAVHAHYLRCQVMSCAFFWRPEGSSDDFRHSKVNELQLTLAHHDVGAFRSKWPILRRCKNAIARQMRELKNLSWSM